MRLLPVLLLALLLPASAAASSARHARDFVVAGYGWGHGVGMSQWGAEGYALHGWPARRILAHYYPGTTLVRQAPQNVRILLGADRSRVALASKAAFVVRDAHGTRLRLRPGRYAVAAALRLQGKQLAAPVRVLPGLAPLSVDGRGYRGSLVLYRSGSALQVVNDVPLERYLRGVVPWEMPHRWAAAALRAQAVAARSYALATLDPDGRYDLVGDARDQMYGGIEAETEPTNLAVGATSGQVLTWDGEVALTYYSSTSGGRTEAVADAFGVPAVPYLRAVVDPYDSLSPHHRWGPYRFAPATLARRLHVPAIEQLTVKRNGSGRVADLVVRWKTGARTLSGRDVEHLLSLPSTWFEVTPSVGGTAPRPSVPVSRPVHGWLAVLTSLPDGSSPKRALARVRRVVPDARAVESSAFGALRPGLVIVAAGPFKAQGDARDRAGRVSGAYVRHV
jgi:stage II sporulation protein D